MSFFLTLVNVLIALALAYPAFTDAVNSSKWPVTNGVVVKNDMEVGRTFVYQVGRTRYSSTFEHSIELTFSRFGLEFTMGHHVTKYNGIDPEIGTSVRVSYNPAKPSEAVVEPGFSIPVIIYLVCTGLILFIRMIFPASYRD
jgi:hypothetical protein